MPKGKKKLKEKLRRCNKVFFGNLHIAGIHTSGHADIGALKQMVSAIKPKAIVPIHTFSGSEYQKIFAPNSVVVLNDGEIRQV